MPHRQESPSSSAGREGPLSSPPSRTYSHSAAETPPMPGYGPVMLTGYPQNPQHLQWAPPYPPDAYQVPTQPHHEARVTPEFNDRAKRMKMEHGRPIPNIASRESPASFNTKEEATIASPQQVGRTPIKKRKKHLDVLRRNGAKLPTTTRTDSPQAHVSPVSSSSSPGNPEDATFMPHQNTPSAHSSSSVSYDVKEAQPLTDSTKVRRPTDIAHTSTSFNNKVHHHPTARQYRTVADFPFVLHKVLCEAEGSVLQWIPHGSAWRVVRWDALRRFILPTYFPELVEEDDGGSIDAFLWNVRAWGFEEIKDGPDVGAYCNERFKRDEPHLCQGMKSASAKTAQKHNAAPKTLLTVPSLTGSRSEGGDNNKSHWPVVAYREEEVHARQYASSPYGWQYGPGHYPYKSLSPPAIRNDLPPPPFESNYPFRSHPESRARHPVAPHQHASIQSGRGGSRASAFRSKVVQSEDARPSFPVSQRGKGSRPKACRIPVQQPQLDCDKSASIGAGSRNSKKNLFLARSSSLHQT